MKGKLDTTITASASEQPLTDDALRESRRLFLQRLGAAAVYTPPAVSALIVSEAARAHHKPDHVNAPNACNQTVNPPFCEQLESGIDANIIESGPSTMGGDPYAKFGSAP